ATLDALPDEKALGTLRVQVVGCKELLSADSNGKSDPYVAVTFIRQRHKTPVISKTLTPKYEPKHATFNFVVYASVMEKIGSLLEFVVWDKDMIGKDYLGELALPANDWFKHSGESKMFDDPNNKDFWLPLVSSRTMGRSRREAKGSINIKIGFVRGTTTDADQAHREIVRRTRGGPVSLLSAPPTQGIGTLGGDGDTVTTFDADSDDEGGDQRSSYFGGSTTDASSLRSARPRTMSNSTLMSVSEEPKSAPVPEKKRNLPTFRLNWAGTKIDYSFSGHRDVAGIVLLEIKSAAHLPKVSSGTLSRLGGGGGGGFDMDPFVVVTYGRKTFRTRVVRQSLDPEWNEKIMFHVHKSDLEEGGKIQIAVLDWDKFASDDLVGDVGVQVADIIARVPPVDPATGLYREDANIANGMADMSLPLTVVGKEFKIDPMHPPTVNISIKYEPHAAFRQRFWRQNLLHFDADNTGKFSNEELTAFLDDLGLALNSDTVNGFWPAHDKKPLDELTLHETIQSLEDAIGVTLEKGQQPRWAEESDKIVGKDPEEDHDKVKAVLDATDVPPVDADSDEPHTPVTPTTPATPNHGGMSADDEGPTTPDSATSARPIASQPVRVVLFSLSCVDIVLSLRPGRPLPFSNLPLHVFTTLYAAIDLARARWFIYSLNRVQRGSTYGRNRESLANLDSELFDLFYEHPDADRSDPEKPTVPGRALIDILEDFSLAHGGMELLDADERGQLQGLLAQNPDIYIGPEMLIGFVAQLTMNSAQQEFEAEHRGEESDEDEHDPRVFGEEGDVTMYPPPGGLGSHSRSSSHSTTTGESPEDYPYGPRTPKNDAFGSRQRSTPIQAAPTSWKPKSNYRRRRSSVGSQGRPSGLASDSDQSGNEQGRTRSRRASRASSRQGSPSRRGSSRPVSPYRSQESLQRPRMGSLSHSGLDESGILVPRGGSDLEPHELTASDLVRRASDSDSDEDSDDDHDHDHDEDDEHLIRPRDSVISMADMQQPFEKIEELQRANNDLTRKVAEAERALAAKVIEHETELEELQARLDEVQEELQTSRHNEKDIRVKERGTQQQIQGLENEISKLQKTLETSRASYQSMQKQYQEQCAESEKYRNSIRRKDQDLKEAEDNAQAHHSEMTKWKAAHEIAEATIQSLEQELQSTRQAQEALAEQKQENMVLRETIDRMRFDLDELRSTKSLAGAGSSRPGSIAGTINASMSRSLANELKAQLAELEEQEKEEDEVEDTERGSDDEFVETIIKRRKKVARKSLSGVPATGIQEELKEYADEGTQFGPQEYTTSSSAQTDPLPVPAPRASSSIQTDRPPTPEPVIVMKEVEVPAPAPPAPPPYEALNDEERQRIGDEVISRWHPGLAAAGVHGVTSDAVREWANLKRELGFECAAIDKVISDAPVTGDRPDSGSERTRESLEIIDNNEDTTTSLFWKLARRVRGQVERSDWLITGALVALCAFGGVWLVSLMLSGLMHSVYPSYEVPTYVDRWYWTTYNTLGVPSVEGMSGRGGIVQGTFDQLWRLLSKVLPLGLGVQPTIVPT
ncbi:hypothetical protein BKA62DRAFT_619610, partial [Auriculariales sp. MPI-PUGE-AT-0066]